MAQILGFVFAGASTVTALAMLLLVVWQAPRHRDNRLMAVYLATLVFWGASNIVARLCSVIGCSMTVAIYSNTFFNGVNSLVLFWFVTDYVGIGRRPWVRAGRVVGLVWLVLGGVAIYTNRILVDPSVTPDGLWSYRLSSLSLPVFAVGHALYLTALACLWIHRRSRAGALLPGGIVLIAGQIGTLALLPFVKGVPPITIAFTAVASVCFTYAILKENLFNPLARSEASMAALLENTTDPVWSVDPDGRLTTFNTAFRHLVSTLHGTAPERGQPAIDVFPEEHRPLLARFYERALRGERVSVERHFDMPGIPEHLEIRFNPIAGAPGQPSASRSSPET